MLTATSGQAFTFEDAHWQGRRHLRKDILGKRVSQAKHTASTPPHVGAVLWVFEMSSGLVHVGGNEEQEEAK
jgi:hypothetical protein